MEKGAKEVHAYITHGVLSGEAIERISNSNLSSMVITDTIEPTEIVTKCAKNPYNYCSTSFGSCYVEYI